MSGFKKILSLSLVIHLMGLFPGACLAASYTVEEGTPLRLRLDQTINSSKNKEGDRVDFKVIEDVMALDGKTVLIKAGTPAWGTIVEANKRGRIGGKGELALQVVGTKAVNGKVVPLRASITREGQSKIGTVVALSLFVSPLFLFMRGRDAKVLAGAEISAYVDRNTQVEIATSPPSDSPDNASVGTTAGSVLPPQIVNDRTVPSYLEKYVEQQTPENETLQALEALRNQGLLSQEEYEAKRQLLLKK